MSLGSGYWSANCLHFGMQRFERSCIIALIDGLLHPFSNLFHVIFGQAAGRDGWRTQADTTRLEWRQRIIGHGILVERQANLIERLFGDFAVNTEALVYVG